MAVDISTQMRCVLYLNHVRGGWSENYWLKTNAYTDALVVATMIANYRRAFMAQNVEIAWGRVSFLGKPKEAQGIEGLPLGPLPQVGSQLTLDNPCDAMHYRFETATGRWGNHLMRGIPDDWVINYRATTPMPEPLSAAMALSNPLDGGAPLLRIQQSFLRYLLTNTQCVRVTAKGPPPLGDQVAWTRCIPRRIGNRKTGRPFGMSRGRA